MKDKVNNEYEETKLQVEDDNDKEIERLRVCFCLIFFC